MTPESWQQLTELAGRRIVSVEVVDDVVTLTVDTGVQVRLRGVERLMWLLPDRSES